MMITIRTIYPMDIDAVRCLGTSLFREEDEVPDLQVILQHYDPIRSFVACLPTKEVVGFTLVRKHTCWSYELAFLAVSPHYQGHKIGSRLLQDTLTAIGDNASCWLLVDTGHPVAYQMYLRAGFCISSHVDGTHPCYKMERKEMEILLSDNSKMTSSERYFYVCLENISSTHSPLLRGFQAIPATSGPDLLHRAMKTFGIREEVAPHLQAWSSPHHWHTSSYRVDTMNHIPDDVEFIWLHAHPSPLQ